MWAAFKEIIRDNWQYRDRIFGLAKFDLVKRTRGTVLSWAWLIIKPMMYLFCFWFALEIGLRSARSVGDGPYIVWLASGIIPWFFMQDMLNMGVDAFRRFTYLVNKVKFPLSAIPTINTASSMGVHLLLLAILLVIYFASGGTLTVYLLQLPIVLVLSFVFWNMFSLLGSLVSAISKDFRNFVRAITTPLFWLSGIIFPVTRAGIEWIQVALYFNPVTFFASVYRDALYYHTWFWEEPAMCGGMLAVFLVTFLLQLWAYKHLKKDAQDEI